MVRFLPVDSFGISRNLDFHLHPLPPCFRPSTPPQLVAMDSYHPPTLPSFKWSLSRPQILRRLPTTPDFRAQMRFPGFQPSVPWGPSKLVSLCCSKITLQTLNILWLDILLFVHRSRFRDRAHHPLFERSASPSYKPPFDATQRRKLQAASPVCEYPPVLLDTVGEF